MVNGPALWSRDRDALWSRDRRESGQKQKRTEEKGRADDPDEFRHHQLAQAPGPPRHDATASTLSLLGVPDENFRYPFELGARFWQGSALLDGKCPRNRIGPLVD